MPFVAGIDIIDSGELYNIVPTVTISLPNQDSAAATAIANIDSSGSISSITVVDGGSYYIAVPDVTVDSAPVGGTTADLTAIVLNNRINSFTINEAGSGYTSAPTITVGDPTGPKSQFQATATATLDTVTKKIKSITIDNRGDFYLGTPDVFISEPAEPNFTAGEVITQSLAGGVTITGEVAKYNDSDRLVTVIHNGADDGKYHDWISNEFIESTDSSTVATVLSVSQVLKQSEVEQNDDFEEFGADFIDFSESNPFGDPS